MRRCVWSRNIKNGCSIYIYDISSLRVNRPVSASSNSLLKGLTSRLRPFGPQFRIIFVILLLFILLHVVANFICIFLVSRQLVLLSALPKFLHSFCCKKRVFSAVLMKTWNSFDVILSVIFFFLFSRVEISLPYTIIRTASAFQTFIHKDFWTKLGLTFWHRSFKFKF